VGPEQAPDSATPLTPLGSTGTASGRAARPAIADGVGATRTVDAEAIAMRAVVDRPERKPVRTTDSLSAYGGRTRHRPFDGFRLARPGDRVAYALPP